jgi:hypothetical protein
MKMAAVETARIPNASARSGEKRGPACAPCAAPPVAGWLEVFLLIILLFVLILTPGKEPNTISPEKGYYRARTG